MSRLGGASAVAQLVADIPLESVEVIEVPVFHHFIIMITCVDHLHLPLLACAHKQIQVKGKEDAKFQIAHIYIFYYPISRVKVVKTDLTSMFGRSGQMLKQKGRQLSSWRTMSGRLCNTFSRNPCASCRYHSLHSSTLLTNRMTPRPSSPNHLLLHRSHIHCTCLSKLLMALCPILLYIYLSLRIVITSIPLLAFHDSAIKVRCHNFALKHSHWPLLSNKV